MKRIIVTGGVGFIGSNLIKSLKDLNYDITSIDNYSTGNSKNELDGVKYLKDEVQNILKIENNFDYCFHLAAQSRVQPSFKFPEDSLSSNVIGTSRVLEWVKNTKTKVIYAGSSSRHHNPYDSPYATYKFLGEEICKMYRNTYKVNVEIARFYNVYGPGENLDEKYGNVIGIWRSKINKKEPLPIVGDGEQKRDFIHVDDVVDGLIKIAFSRHTHKDAWELGTGVSYSVNQIYNYFNNRYKISYVNIPDQPGNYRETLRENQDALNLLNWKPKDRLQNYILNLKA